MALAEGYEAELARKRSTEQLALQVDLMQDAFTSLADAVVQQLGELCMVFFALF